MSDGSVDLAKDARVQAYALTIEEVNPAQAALFQADAMWPYFERLRREDPVHYTAQSEFGPYWSITKFNDIMAVETNHQVFSSESTLGGITIGGQAGGDGPRPMFISMDPPKHDVQRKTVSPAVSPSNPTHAGADHPRAGRRHPGFPADRRGVRLGGQGVDRADHHDAGHPVRLPLRRAPQADPLVGCHHRAAGPWDHRLSMEQKMAEMMECFQYFGRLWNERVNAPPAGDLISMMAHAEATRNMDPREYQGNIVLLIVGGNDTTRNTITGSVLALNQNPDQYAKLRENPDLIASMVSETIRWQTPLAHMRRTALSDIEFQGKSIKKGDKVVMWYVSGNRDEEVIEDADRYIIDRERPRHHVSFGFGIHRCVGNRLAELQLKVIWEEILARFPDIRVVGEPKRVYSTFIKGYESLPVVIPARV